MRKILASTLAAVTLGGAVAATAGPAEAQSYYRRHRDNDNDAAAAAIVAGVAGLAIGAAIGSNRNRGYYGDSYYDPRYRSGYGYGHAPSYGYSYPRYSNYGYAPRYNYGHSNYGYSPYGGYGHRTCTAKERVYDPYTGRRMTIRRQYAC